MNNLAIGLLSQALSVGISLLAVLQKGGDSLLLRLLGGLLGGLLGCLLGLRGQVRACSLHLACLGGKYLLSRGPHRRGPLPCAAHARLQRHLVREQSLAPWRRQSRRLASDRRGIAARFWHWWCHGFSQAHNCDGSLRPLLAG
ncbi:MAG: hypothetical protein MUF06_14910 [Pirellulaceae bacterium]|nr:hypothetical protein [Pirellulaceae bacterium]